MAESRDEVMDSTALCEGKSGPSFFKNSCTGMELMFNKERCDGFDRNEELRGTSADAVSINPVQNNSKWCINLRYMPIFTDKHLRGVSGQAVQPAPLASLMLSMAVYGQKLDGRPSG